MEHKEIICDICGMHIDKARQEFEFCMQVHQTKMNGDFKYKYSHKDLCPRCVSSVLRHINERKRTFEEFRKHALIKKRRYECSND